MDVIIEDLQTYLADYKSLRPVSIALSKRLTECLLRDDFGLAAGDLGMLGKMVGGKREILLETDDEIVVVADYAIHEVRHDGKNAVDRLLEESAVAEGTPELRLLQALQQSEFHLLHVERPLPGYGVLAFVGEEQTPRLVMDVGFSQTAVRGSTLATRLLTPSSGLWWMTTGAALPVTAEAMLAIVKGVGGFQEEHGAPPRGHDFARVVMRECVAAGASRKIRYEDVSRLPTGRERRQPAAAEQNVGRNEPCPCGSGKKYKKCCGRA